MENLNKVKNKVEEMKAKYSLEQEQEDNPNHSDGFGMYWSGFFTCLKEISFFLDSLQQEQQVDLEKEIKDTCRRYWINDFHEQELGKLDIENIARHFYELGKNAK